MVIGQEREIRIPPEACREYGFLPRMEIAFAQGSRTSGGFGIGKRETLQNNVWMGGRILATGSMGKGGLVVLPPVVSVAPGERLLAVCGSGLALGFLQRGPILQIALKHPEIETFVP